MRAVLPLLQAHEELAARVLPPDVHAWCAGGAGAQVTLDEAQQAWAAVRLRPRVLRDVSSVDTSLVLLGRRLATPVLVGPTALHALVHPGAEPATARGARAAGSLHVLSTRSSTPVEQVGADPFWLQVYVLRDRSRTLELVQRAAAAGAGALVLTGDTPYVGTKRGAVPEGVAQPPELQQDPSAGLEVVAWLAERSGLPVLVKGVLRGDDARACLDAGAAGLVVSNHGGRQLDRAVATARALPEVVAAVPPGVPVLVDGGLRSGLDVLCALALGATAVLLGRPVLWGLAFSGARGVEGCLRAVTEDLAHVMALAGAADLSRVTADLVDRTGRA